MKDSRVDAALIIAVIGLLIPLSLVLFLVLNGWHQNEIGTIIGVFTSIVGTLVGAFLDFQAHRLRQVDHNQPELVGAGGRSPRELGLQLVSRLFQFPRVGRRGWWAGAGPI